MCWAIWALVAMVIFVLGIILGRKCNHRQEGAYGKATDIRPMYNDEEEEEEVLKAEIALGIVGQDVFLAKYGTVVHLSETCQGLNLTKRENIRRAPVCLHCLNKRRKETFKIEEQKKYKKKKDS